MILFNDLFEDLYFEKILNMSFIIVIPVAFYLVCSGKI